MSGPIMYPPQFALTDRTARINNLESLLTDARTNQNQNAIKYYEELIKEQKNLISGEKGEKYVFETLQRILPDDWYVFHSYVLCDFNVRGGQIDYSPEYSYNRELDFIIISPTAGILVLEVKHWQVNTAEENENIAANVDKRHRTPIEQASSAARTLAKWLMNKHGLIIPEKGCNAAAWMTLGYTESQRRNPKYWCGQVDNKEDIVRWLESHFNAYCSPESWDLEKTIELLSHTERYSVSLSDYDRIIDQATAKVNNLLPMLNQQKCKIGIAIEGCAGSGKTVMAVKEAGRLARQHRVLFLCYTANLPIWLKCNYKKELADVDVYTFHGYCSKILNAPCNDDRFAIEYAKIKNLITTKEAYQYDYIFVDEAQDFESKWWNVLTYALANNRKSNNNAMFYLFFDLNQNLRNAGNPPPVPITITLDTNLRNSNEIAKYSCSILKNKEIKALDLRCQEVTIYQPLTTTRERNMKIREIVESITSDTSVHKIRKKGAVPDFMLTVFSV